MLRSPLRRLSAAQIISGATAGAAAAALAVPAALAGSASTTSQGQGSSHSRSSLASAQQQNDHLSAATSQRLASISTQVNSLLGKMTVAEKIGQLEMAGPSGANGTPGQPLLDAAKSGGIGSGLDVIHGYKTIFPVPIAEASSWDPAAISSDESISASEATADGIKWTFNPMVDVSRDPRWGRVVEGAGEDPYL